MNNKGKTPVQHRYQNRLRKQKEDGKHQQGNHGMDTNTYKETTNEHKEKIKKPKKLNTTQTKNTEMDTDTQLQTPARGQDVKHDNCEEKKDREIKKPTHRPCPG